MLPCGLTQRQVLDLLYRDIDPEDFETLKALDETVPNKTVFLSRWNSLLIYVFISKLEVN